MTGTLFGLTFLVAAPFWALMILLRRWRWTERIIGSPATIFFGPLGLWVHLAARKTLG
ncbi:abscisic acid-deficient protein Aba4 family protein [Actinoplanes sp. NPDC051513]|uniref:abscisic acid-deficient protein Aba4 family protein n=1 Tax=Actinoplanes sp. NPDC051513 TaxID=3363908 RepID=UPI0037A22A04